MPNVVRLGRGAAKAIHAHIDELFDRAKVRFLGPQAVRGKRIYVTYHRELSLPGIFEAGSREEGSKPDIEVLEGLLNVAGNYIEGSRERTKARVINEINAAIMEARHAKGGMDREEFRVLVNTKLSDVWGEVRNNIHAIVDTETSRAKNTSVLEGIIGANAAAGIEDPVVYFVVVRDNVLCAECKRLHLMPNGVTPRLWYLSELGHGFHKKGEESPKLGGLHPHCRCTLVTLMPGFYFNSSGMVTFKKPGFNGIEHQRRLERSEAEFQKNWKGVATAAALALAPTQTGMEGRMVAGPPKAPKTAVALPEALHPHLKVISFLETSGGKNLAHIAHSKGDFHTAVGEVGLKPVTAHEHYLKSPELQAQFPNLHDQQTFLKAFKGNKRLYTATANHVWGKLLKKLKTPERAAYGWRHGLTAALRSDPDAIRQDGYVDSFLKRI